MVALQVPLQLAQQPARNRAQRAVGPLRLPVVLGMVAEALVTVDRLELAGVASARRQPLGLDNLPIFSMTFFNSFASVGYVTFFSWTVESMMPVPNVPLPSWSSLTRMLSAKISSTPLSPMR